MYPKNNLSIKHILSIGVKVKTTNTIGTNANSRFRFPKNGGDQIGMTIGLRPDGQPQKVSAVGMVKPRFYGYVLESR